MLLKHIKTNTDNREELMSLVKEELDEHCIFYATIELENTSYECSEEKCEVKVSIKHCHHH